MGVEWLTLADGTRPPARPASLAHLRRRASEKEWPEARWWCERRQLNQGYVLRKKGKPDPTPARAEKTTASRYYSLPAAVIEGNEGEEEEEGDVAEVETDENDEEVDEATIRLMVEMLKKGQIRFH